MKAFAFKFPQVSHIGNTVSHAKNRKKRAFKYNLHTVTVVVDGKKQRMRVPTKILRMLKQSGMTTHFKPAEKPAVKVEKKPMVIEQKMAIKKAEPKTEVKAKTKTKAKAKPKKTAKPKK